MACLRQLGAQRRSPARRPAHHCVRHADDLPRHDHSGDDTAPRFGEPEPGFGYLQPGPQAPSIISVRGDADTPTEATILSQGTTSFLGKILVEAPGGNLAIDVASDGSTANFIIKEDALVLVTQESSLTLSGSRVTNNGLIQIEGVAQVAAGLNLLGTGIIEVDNGGFLDVAGKLGARQSLFLADGTGDVAIADLDLFNAGVGLTVYGGNRFFLEDIKVRSASWEDGELTLYRGKNQKGAVQGEFSLDLINGASLTALSESQQTLSGKDFAFESDGAGGTIMTYAPRGPQFVEASLPVPVIAETGTTVSLEAMHLQAFGTSNPNFERMILMPATRLDTPSAYWGQKSVNGGEPILSAWIVNGKVVTKPTKVKAGDDVQFLVGNNIGFPPHLRAQVTEASKGVKAGYLDYYLWTVDPAVAGLVQGSGYTPGKPLPSNILTSAASYETVYGAVFNTDLCNWIADNVAAAAGAPMPVPNQLLEPEINVEGGFWRIAYRGTDSDNPVVDWNTLVEPGDIVRLEWATTGAGHTTTVLAVNEDGTIKVYDNIDVIDGEHHIGAHDDVAYWKQTDPAGITIYRLDPDGQYLINGTSLAESIQGSVFDDLVHAGKGADRVFGSTGSDELHGGRGKDILRGGDNDDVLFGGALKDRLSGGDGSNLFAYTSIQQSQPKPSSRDTILDFTSGVDRIDLSVINDKLEASGKKPFHFIGEEEFTGQRGELIYIDFGKYLVVEGDRNGDAVADFAIKVFGASSLAAADFVLSPGCDAGVLGRVVRHFRHPSRHAVANVAVDRPVRSG